MNTYAARLVAIVCLQFDIPLLSFSTDQVFNGNASEPYIESSLVNPLNMFGISKAEAERQIVKEHPGALVIRTGPLLCEWDEDPFLTVALRNLQEGFLLWLLMTGYSPLPLFLIWLMPA